MRGRSRWANSLVALAMVLGATARGCGGESRRAPAEHASGAAGKASGTAGSATVGASVGIPCVADEESLANFDGFTATEVVLEPSSSACGGGVCAMNHFQGRASCPYGQTDEDLQDGGARCFLPGTTTPVTVPVPAQLLARRANDVAVCTCRCAGPGSGPFCTCENGTECAPLVQALGIGPDEEIAGSYCLKPGTTDYDAAVPRSATCNRAARNCDAEDSR
jgi:hypothetical protein